jgi:ribosomal protein S18 acetylase RimI-like enzyme
VVQFVVDEASLLNIAVEPTQQKQGIGRLLLDEVLAQASAKKATTVFLEVRASNQRAIQMYQQAGFNEMGLRKNYYPSAQWQRTRGDDGINGVLINRKILCFAFNTHLITVFTCFLINDFLNSHDMDSEINQAIHADI